MSTFFPPKTVVFIVDDHPMTVDGYVSLISKSNKNNATEFHLAYDCRTAYQQITKFSAQSIFPSVAFLDVNLPAYEEQQLQSGLDIASIIRDRFPYCKIVIVTMHNEPLWVHQIIDSINPEGFICKSEINYSTFSSAFKKIMSGQQFFSPSITESQHTILSKNLRLDHIDSKILLLLSEGKKTVNLPDFIDFSLSSIEKRKANIKKQLLLDGRSDQELLEAAKNFGLF